MKKFAVILAILILLIITGCSNSLGGGYKFYQHGKYTLYIVDSENNVVISSCILKYTFDSNYILVAQRPWDSVPGSKKMTYKQANKAFEKSTFIQYWIIDKKKKDVFNEKTRMYSNVFGPYKKDGFLKKKNELGVPDNLKLKLK